MFGDQAVDFVPEIAGDDGLVFSGIGDIPIRHLADINFVFENPVERFFVDGLPCPVDAVESSP